MSTCICNDDGKWSCTFCTFLNKSGCQSCELCGNPRTTQNDTDFWVFTNENGTVVRCNKDVSKTCDLLTIGQSTYYIIDNFTYLAKKVSQNKIEQTNTTTNKIRYLTKNSNIIGNVSATNVSSASSNSNMIINGKNKQKHGHVRKNKNKKNKEYKYIWKLIKTHYICKCGIKLKKMQAGKIYSCPFDAADLMILGFRGYDPQSILNKSKRVSCNICGKSCGASEYVYHCPMNKNINHKGGYDLCSYCAIPIGCSETNKTFDDLNIGQTIEYNGCTINKRAFNNITATDKRTHAKYIYQSQKRLKKSNDENETKTMDIIDDNNNINIDKIENGIKRINIAINHSFSIDYVSKRFYETMNCNRWKIIAIEKLACDDSIFNTILNKKQKKTTKLLFHGTNESTLIKIIKNGFNRDFNKRSAYGKGVYFARDAKYSASYCVGYDSNGGMKSMLACNVIIGEYCVGNSNNNDNNNGNKQYKSDGITEYDTMVDKLENPSIYVITRDFHAIPLFLIKFKQI